MTESLKMSSARLLALVALAAAGCGGSTREPGHSEPDVSISGNPFSVSYSQNGAHVITGGSTVAHLTFVIPTLSGGVASLTDSLGNSYFDGATILGASGSTLDGPLPATASTDSFVIRYTLTVSNATTSLQRTASMTVVPVPVVMSFGALPAAVTDGSTTRLLATFTGGTGMVTGTNGFTPAVIFSGTPLVVAPPSDLTTTYTLTVTNAAVDAAGVVTSAPVNVQSVAAPSIASGSLTVTNVGAGASGSGVITGGSTSGTLTLGIPTLGSTVTSAVLAGPDGPVKDSTTGNPVSSAAILAASGGTVTNVKLPATTATDSTRLLYTLTVSNAAGDTTSTTAQLTVVPVPVITSFSAAATRVADGINNTSLTAQFSGGTGEVSNDAFATSTPITSNAPLAVTSSSDTVSTWRLRVTNPARDSAGTVAFGSPVSVTAVGPPTATGRLAVSPHVLGFSPFGGNLLFTAPIFGPTVVSAMISGGGASASVSSGGAVTSIPAPTAATTYTLTLSNGAGGTLTQAATVLVGDVVGAQTLPATQTNCGAASCIGRFGVTATWIGGSSTRVLLAGGSSSPNCTGTIANGWVYYDTGTASVVNSGVFSQVTTGRCGHSATLLANGKIALIGGVSSVDSRATHIDLFDPTGSGVISDDRSLLTKARCGHVAAPVAAGSSSVVVAGGTDCSTFPTGTALGSVEIYTPSIGASAETPVSATLGVTRVNATATLLGNGKVLIAGGNASTTHTADLFTFNSGAPSTSTLVASANEMQFARSNHTATLLQSGKVLLVGGAGTNTTADVYDPAAGTFGGPGVSSTAARALHGATLLPSGLVLIAGGVVSGSAAATTEFYDPGTSSFTNSTSVIPLSSPRSQFQLVNVGDLNFAFGGDGGGGGTIDELAVP